jgi:hypothetical protein
MQNNLPPTIKSRSTGYSFAITATGRLLALAGAFLVLTPGLQAQNIPVKVDVRNSVLSNTILVAEITSTSNKPLLLHAEFRRATGDLHKTFTFTLPANGLKVIGRVRGWNVKADDRITITAPGYSDLHWRAP